MAASCGEARVRDPMVTCALAVARGKVLRWRLGVQTKREASSGWARAPTSWPSRRRSSGQPWRRRPWTTTRRARRRRHRRRTRTERSCRASWVDDRGRGAREIDSAGCVLEVRSSYSCELTAGALWSPSAVRHSAWGRGAVQTLRASRRLCLPHILASRGLGLAGTWPPVMLLLLLLPPSRLRV